MKVRLISGAIPQHGITAKAGTVVDIPAYAAERLVREGHAEWLHDPPRAPMRADVRPVVPGKAVETMTREPEEEREATPAAAGESEINATPAAVELAEAHSIDLSAVSGSGPGGRITKPDVERAIEQS